MANPFTNQTQADQSAEDALPTTKAQGQVDASDVLNQFKRLHANVFNNLPKSGGTLSGELTIQSTVSTDDPRGSDRAKWKLGGLYHDNETKGKILDTDRLVEVEIDNQIVQLPVYTEQSINSEEVAELQKVFVATKDAEEDSSSPDSVEYLTANFEIQDPGYYKIEMQAEMKTDSGNYDNSFRYTKQDGTKIVFANIRIQNTDYAPFQAFDVVELNTGTLYCEINRGVVGGTSAMRRGKILVTKL